MATTSENNVIDSNQNRRTSLARSLRKANPTYGSGKKYARIVKFIIREERKYLIKMKIAKFESKLETVSMLWNTAWYGTKWLVRGLNPCPMVFARLRNIMERSFMRGLKETTRRHVQKVKARLIYQITLSGAQWLLQKPTIGVALIEVLKIMDTVTDGGMSRLSGAVIANMMDKIEEYCEGLKSPNPIAAQVQSGASTSSLTNRDYQPTPEEMALLRQDYAAVGKIIAKYQSAETPVTPDIVATLGALVASAVVGGSVSSSKTLTGMMTKTGNIGRDFSNSLRGVQSMRTVITDILTAVKYYLGIWQEDDLLKDAKLPGGINLPMLITLIRDVVAQTPGATRGVAALREQIETIRVALNEFDLLVLHNKVKVTNRVLNIVKDASITFRKYLTENASLLALSGTGRKRTPVVFEFTGESGCGKSQLMDLVAFDMTNPDITQNIDWQIDNLIYSENPNNKHMDGYMKQDIHIQDDARQSTGHTPDNSEVLGFIRLVSPVEFFVPQAQADKKGMTYASKLILLTTNDPYTMHKEVVCKHAVWRRRQAVVHVSVCKDKECSKCKTGNLRDKHYTFLDPMGGEILGDNMVASGPKFERYWTDSAGNSLIDLSYYEMMYVLGNIMTKWHADDPIMKDRPPVDDDALAQAKVKMDKHKFAVFQMTDEEYESLYPQEKDLFILREENGITLEGASIREEPLHLYSNERQCCARDWELDYTEVPPLREWDMSVCYKTRTIYERSTNQRYSFNRDVWTDLTLTEQFVFKLAVKNRLIKFIDYKNLQGELKRQEEEAQVAFRQGKFDSAIERAFNVAAILYAVRKVRPSFHVVPDCCDYYCEGRRYCNGEVGITNQTILAGEDGDRALAARHNRTLYNKFDPPKLVVGELRSPIAVFCETMGEQLCTIEVEEGEHGRARHEALFGDDQDPDLIEELESCDDGDIYRSKDIFEFLGIVNVEQRKRATKWKVVAGVVGLISVGLAALVGLKVWEQFTNKKKTAEDVIAEIDPDMTADEREIVQAVMTKMGGFEFASGDHVTRKIGLKRVGRHQFGTDVKDGIKEKVRQNLTLLKVTLMKNQQPIYVSSVQGTGLKNHLLVTNAHPFLVMRDWDAAEVTIERMGGAQDRASYTQEQIAIDEKNDLVLLKVPVQMDAYKNIVPFFTSDNQLNILTEGPATLIGAAVDDTVYFVRRDEQIVESRTGEELIYVKGYEYSMTTKVGMCGRPLMAHQSDGLNRTIMGIHHAGTGSEGYARPVTQELIEEMSAKIPTNAVFNMECGDESMFDDVINTESTVPQYVKTEGNVEFVGIAQKAYAQGPAMKTEVAESYVHGKMGELLTAPAVTSLRDSRVDPAIRAAGVTPYDAGFKKFSVPTKALPVRASLMAMAVLTAVLSALKPCIGIGKRLLTWDEQINGTAGDEVNSLDFDTSPGLWKRFKPAGAKGKRWMFDITLEPNKRRFAKLKEKFDSKGIDVIKLFRKSYDEMEMKVRSGQEILLTLYSNLKDERRKLKHIKNAKTRTFDVSPLEYNMLLRKYFGAFNAAMQKECVTLPVGVGLNLTGADAEGLYNRIGRFGGNVIAGDFETWDGNLSGEAMMQYAIQANEWYKDCVENQRARIGLIRAMIHPLIISLNTVARKHQGIPSGVAVTAPMNSLCNWHLQLVALIDILMKERIELATRELIEGFEITTWGDDHIVAPKAEYQKYVNFKSVKKWFTEHGIGYTDAMKSDREFDFEALDDIYYCKRKFEKHSSGVIVAPLDKTVLNEMINWRRKTPGVSKRLSFEETRTNYVHELSLHGEQYFEQEINRLNAAVKLANEEFPHLTQNPLMDCKQPYCVFAQKILANYGK